MLGLDLSASEAKVARAREHSDALNREITRFVDERKPCRVTAERDNKTGWLRVFVSIAPFYQPRISTIVGDIFHNLRCALDFIVTALVNASETRLTRKHQFPIFDSRIAYERRVGNAYKAIEGGNLEGVTCGLQQVWDLQPFHAAEPRDTDLFLIRQFSNTDKHRMIVTSWLVVPEKLNINISTTGITAEERMQTTIDADPGRKYEIYAARFERPFPAHVKLDYETNNVFANFGAPAFERYESIAIPEMAMTSLCDYVANVVVGFKAL